MTHLKLVSFDAQGSISTDVQACASVLTDTFTFTKMGIQKFSDIPFGDSLLYQTMGW